MKKILFILFTLSLFIFFGTKLDFQRFSKEPCPFCDPKTLEAQEFYHGPGVLGFLTHKPVVPGHVLIIPERHVERFEDLTSEELAAIGEAIKKIHITANKTFGVKEYLLLQKNGPRVGQSVAHVHFHYISAGKFLAIRFFASSWLKPLTADEIKLLRDALAESL